MGRKRLAQNRGFPPNLYLNSAGYFYFVRPGDKKVKGLGRDKAHAIAEVRAANAVLANEKPSALADWALGKSDYTLLEWLPLYKRLWCEQSKTPPAANTLRNAEMYLRKIADADYARRKLGAIETAHVAKHLLAVTDDSGSSAAICLRARLSDVFRMAETQGLIAAGANPVKSTYTPTRTVKRERMTLDQFHLIHAQAPIWLKSAMNLALLTAQRREDLTNMKFADFTEGNLHVAQGKGRGSVRLRLDGAIRLTAVGMSIAEAVAACRNHVSSSYLVHHVEHVSSAKPGDKVSVNGLSNTFQRARESAGIEASIEGRTPPSFHEIRSLSERLYRDQYGAEFAQAMLGHKHASMTAMYDDMRGQGWQSVTVKIL